MCINFFFQSIFKNPKHFWQSYRPLKYIIISKNVYTEKKVKIYKQSVNFTINYNEIAHIEFHFELNVKLKQKDWNGIFRKKILIS